MSPVPNKSVGWSIAILVGAALLAGGALYYNAPGTKQLDFEVACERFPVVGSLAFDLHQGATQLVRVVADDFQGSASGVERTIFVRRSEPPASLALTTPTFGLDPPVASNEPNAHLDLVRRNTMGRLSLVVRGPAVLSATTASSTGSPWLTVESHADRDTELTVSSETIHIDSGNRYTIREIAANVLQADFTATLSSSTLVEMKLQSRANRRTFASLIFRNADTSLPVLTAPQTPSPNSNLSFVRAMNPVLRLDNKRVEGIPTDQRVQLEAKYSAATINSITIVNDPERRGLPALLITGSATAHSLRLDGRELISTKLDDILNEPVASRSTMLILLGLAVAVLVKVVDHAIGVILDRLIPKD